MNREPLTRDGTDAEQEAAHLAADIRRVLADVERWAADLPAEWQAQRGDEFSKHLDALTGALEGL
ncbi:MAG: hypothetical protein ACE15C_20045 [Phycisphaerae bacterium]